MVYDDYDQPGYQDDGKRQEPIISREEARRLQEAHDRYYFIYHLMQPFTYWNSLLDDPDRKPTGHWRDADFWGNVDRFINDYGERIQDEQHDNSE